MVSEVLDSVRKNGDRALIEFTARFDGVLYDSAEDMVVSRNEIQEAYETVKHAI